MNHFIECNYGIFTNGIFTNGIFTNGFKTPKPAGGGVLILLGYERMD
jgi:hypothetical protein